MRSFLIDWCLMYNLVGAFLELAIMLVAIAYLLGLKDNAKKVSNVLNLLECCRMPRCANTSGQAPPQ